MEQREKFNIASKVAFSVLSLSVASYLLISRYYGKDFIKRLTGQDNLTLS